MKISVIIPTYNEKGVLEDCVQSLGDQTFTDFEIIVIDDGSTDKTSETLKSLFVSLAIAIEALSISETVIPFGIPVGPFNRTRTEVRLK